MYRSSFQFILVAAVSIAAAVAPLVRASLACCAGEGQVGQAVAVAVPADTGLTGCGSCCESQDRQSPSESPDDGSDSDRNDPSDPCGEDCGCTLCRVMTSVTPAFVEGQTMPSTNHPSDPAFAEPDRTFARDAAFGLLRPPQH